MALKGDLQSVDLAQVFQMLALNQKVGILCIQAPRAWKALYFDERGATLYYNEHVLLDRVLQHMTRSGRIDEDAVVEAREHSVQHNVGLIDSLVAGGYVDEADLQESVSIEMEEEIYDLFFWRDATFEFYEGAQSVEGREGQIDEGCFFSTDSLIMEAARRIDEWSFIRERVPGPLEIYYPATDNVVELVDVDDSTLSVFDVVDGKRNVARIVEITGLPAFTVYKAMAVLLDAGALAPLAGDEILAAAEECAAERRWQDAINAYEQAINCEVGIPDAHIAVADVYEQQTEYELAAYHRKCHAEFFAADGLIKEAIETLQGVIEMMPTDLAARERLVELTVGRNDLAKTIDPVQAGKELVELYLEIGELERVRGILERLLRDNPYDIELKKSLVNVHTKAGDTRRVIELYESMAEDLVDQGEPIEAVKYLHKILHLDRDRKDVLEQIRSLYELDERRRSRRRSLLVLGASFCVLAAIAVVWFFYEQHARQRLDAIEAKARQLVKQEKFQLAEVEYQRFVDQYPLTIVSSQARTELERIQALRRAVKQREEAEERRRQKEFAKKRKAYKEEYRQVAEVLSNNAGRANLPAIIERLESVLGQVKAINQPPDWAWAQSVKLEREIQGLRSSMQAAFDLNRKAREQLEVGDWIAARATIQRLIENHSLTPLAASVRIPVRITTRPSGASLLLDGKVLTDGDGNVVTTPTVIQVPRTPSGTVEFELRLDGFEPVKIDIAPLEQPSFEQLLTVVPYAGFKFPSPVNGQVVPSVDGGKVLGAAMQGGQVGFVDRDSGKLLQAIKLPGLEEAVQPPLIVGSRIFIATGNAAIAAYSPSRLTPLWRAQMDETPAWPMVVHEGRLLVADDSGRLMAYDVNSGRRLWMVPMEGDIVGAPIPSTGRGVWVATANGRIAFLDSATGAVVRAPRATETIDTPMVKVAGTKGVVFGADSRDLVYFDLSRGMTGWRLPIGQTLTTSDLSVHESVIVVGTSNGGIQVVDGRDGSVLSESKLPGKRSFAPVVTKDKVLVAVREYEGTENARDLLLAMDRDDLSPLWEFRDARFLAAPTTDGEHVWVPDSVGTVRRFQ